MHDMTGGSATRDGRVLDGPALRFDLGAELAALKVEPGLEAHGRATKTLARSGSLRVVLTCARDGAVFDEDDADGPVAVQVIDGCAQVDRAGARVPLDAGSMLWLGAGPAWQITADGDTSMLLTFGWPTAGDGE